jgi:UDP-2-acetamido-2,6-beta-L-arabino-hexul-4-ose reductase
LIQRHNNLNILVTGADGFIGKNVVDYLKNNQYCVTTFTRGDSNESLKKIVKKMDFIVHLAGENRPSNLSEFKTINVDLTRTLCDAIRTSKRKVSLILSSSIQVKLNNHYGKSKLAAEEVVIKMSKETGNPVYIYRLPNVFGKWCKPNYNSVVATFCYNIANNIPIKISDSSKNLNLIYIDDLVSDFVEVIQKPSLGVSNLTVEPEYSISLGNLAKQIKVFKRSRENLITEPVGKGLVRALYSTYVSYIPASQFVYPLLQNKDDRGIFVEILKTKDSGQFSYFTSSPGVTRGEHYHHSKTEKFVVIQGSAKFKFRNIITNENYELYSSGEKPQVVESSPGWAHNITNIGNNQMIVMLWANEIFNTKYPDTIGCEV